MPFDKLKTLRAAEKYLELGKIPAAIKEYCQVVEQEPDDFTTLNMVGDLYARIGNQSAAISCFRTIAEHYREQDFAFKAIAMYKKIDRLQPHDPEIAANLADLYAQQHLMVEARAHYLIVAEAHTRSGASQEGLEVLRKIANLDPQNTEIRTKLAHGYLKEGMSAEAAAAFTEVGQHLLAQGSCDNALDAFGKALEIYPADHTSLKGLLAAHIAHGTAGEAAEVIERACEANPDDVPLLSLSVSAFVAADDAARADQILAELVTKEPSEYLRYVDVARLYLSGNQVEEAILVIAKIAERMLAAREENLFLELVNETLACDSSNVQALRLLARGHWWQRDVEKVKAALERLAETAQAAGLQDDERYALTQLTRLAPEQNEHVERLAQLGGALESGTEDTLSEFENAAAQAEDASDHFTFEQTVATPVGESEFEWNALSTEAEEWAETTDTEAVEHDFTFEAVVAEELPLSPAEQFANSAADEKSRRAAVRTQELESVDFYIAQGYLDIAHDTLNLLEQQFGAHPDIDVRRRKLSGNATTSEISADEPRTVVDGHIFRDAEPNAPPMLGTPEHVITSDHHFPMPASQVIDPGLAEIFEEYRLSAEAETDSAVNGDYETHYNLGLAYKEMDLFEEALEEFQIAAGLVVPGDGSGRYLQCCNLLGHCFMQKGVPQLAVKWFNKGLNAPDASEDERQALRYELGSAYEQSGDLNRAIDLFTEVYGINVSYRGVNERLRTLQARLAGDNGRAVPQSQPHQNQVERLN